MSCTECSLLLLGYCLCCWTGDSGDRVEGKVPGEVGKGIRRLGGREEGEFIRYGKCGTVKSVSKGGRRLRENEGRH